MATASGAETRDQQRAGLRIGFEVAGKRYTGYCVFVIPVILKSIDIAVSARPHGHGTPYGTYVTTDIGVPLKAQSDDLASAIFFEIDAFPGGTYQ